MPFTLRIASVVLRSQEMEHIESLVTRFLLPRSLANAVNFRSTELLDWIWEASCTPISARAPTWTLTNYLRSYNVYYRLQFRKAIMKAVELDSLEIVKWLFAHFSWCVFPVDAINLAAANGSIDIIKFLVEYDGEDADTIEELMNYRISTIAPVAGENIMIEWGLLSKATDSAIAKGNVDIVWWLFQQAPYQRLSNRQTDGLSVFIKFYLRMGDVDRAESFLPSGDNIFDYARQCPLPQVIGAMMDRGYYTQREETSAANALPFLAAEGCSDLVKRLLRMYPPPLSPNLWQHNWCSAMEEACRCGHLSVLKRLKSHPMGGVAIKMENGVGGLISLAASAGHVSIMNYLCKQSIVSLSNVDLKSATDAPLASVKWLVKRFPDIVQSLADSFIQSNAENGRLKTLKFLGKMDKRPNYGLMRRRKFSWPSTCHAIDAAATNGHLATLVWLHSKYPERCSTAAMDGAAANGHLAVVQWLHTHRREGCTANAMDGAAANGHLHVVEWLHKNRSKGCTAHAMKGAAENRHFEMMKWLHANRLKGCSLTSLCVRRVKIR